MSQDDKRDRQNAPQDDTSALFVSARKKQLEQQEAERRAREREEERRKAEDEVRRLEAEVAERKRRAEEEAERVAREAEQRQRDAEEAAKNAAKEAAKAASKAAAQPATAPASTPKNAGFGFKGLLSNKMVLIGGAGAVVLIAVVIVLIATLGGGNGAKGAKSAQAKATAAPTQAASRRQAELPAYMDRLAYQQGDWYMDGDFDMQAMRFDGEGGWELVESDGTVSVSGFLELDEENNLFAVAPADGVEVYLDVQIIDEDHFEMYSDGEVLGVFYHSSVSEFYEMQGGEMEDFVLDIDAPLDQSAVINSIGMIVYYPGDSFYVDTLSEGRLILKSLDGSATMEVSKGAIVDGSFDDDDRLTYAYNRLTRQAASLPNLIETQEPVVADVGGIPLTVYGAAYESNGETRNLMCFSGVWQNVNTGELSHYDYDLDCTDFFIENYIEIASRILLALGDA